MGLSSMTGFASTNGSAGRMSWNWELKSVNNKAFDLRLRLPQGFEALENPVRQTLGQHFKRGSLQVTLTVQGGEKAEKIIFNGEILEQYVVLATELSKRLGTALPGADALISLRGVVEMSTAAPDVPEQQERETAILLTLKHAATALAGSRKKEGAELTMILAAQLDHIETLLQAAQASPSRRPETIRQRLQEQIATLLEIHNFDAQRLHQEAVVLATKADVREELDRLCVHIKAARELLQSGDPVGRKFDFLAQEFNREANTFCSKASDASLTAIGLDLKTTIDQMREQVQNIE